MLHAKIRGNRPAGSGEEDCLRVFTIYGHGGHLGHVTQMPRTNFRSPYPRRHHINIYGHGGHHGHVTSILSSDFYFLVTESFHT